MSLLSKLFGPKPAAAAAPETYQGFRITPEPIPAPGGHRIAARIETGAGDSLQTHHMIRADTVGERDQAEAISLAKAKLLIDEQGAAIFGK